MNQIAKYQGFKSELAIAETFDEIKLIENKASVVAEFARKNKIGTHEQNEWGKFRVEIEAKKGEWLDEKFPKGGDRKSSSPSSNLIKEGITADESSNARLVAKEKGLVEEVMAEIEGKGDVITPTKVAAEVRKKKKKEERETRQDNKLNPLPKNKYRTIVIDPPWPIEKISRDVRPNQTTIDYPTMTIEEIKSFPLNDIAYQDGCHIYLWTTHKFLPIAFDIFETWGVKYQCLLTWVKNVGITPFSFMYSTEHVLFGRIGTLDLLKCGERLDFSAKATGHSIKPDVFYDLVKKVSPEPRIDVFNRRPIEGFDRYGNEV